MTPHDDILTPRQQYERDVRLHGLTVARWLEQRISVSRESSRADIDSTSRIGVTNEGHRPQATCPTIHGADKPLTKNLKSLDTFLWD